MLRLHARAIRLVGHRLGHVWGIRGGRTEGSQRQPCHLETRLLCHIHLGDPSSPTGCPHPCMLASNEAGIHQLRDVLQANIGGLLTFTAALRALPAVTAVAASLCGNMLISVCALLAILECHSRAQQPQPSFTAVTTAMPASCRGAADHMHSQYHSVNLIAPCRRCWGVSYWTSLSPGAGCSEPAACSPVRA